MIFARKMPEFYTIIARASPCPRLLRLWVVVIIVSIITIIEDFSNDVAFQCCPIYTIYLANIINQLDW